MKLRLALLGRHSNRTPLAYPAYQALCAPWIEFVDNPESADIILFSALKNIREEAGKLAALQRRQCLPELVVISEEPLWDLIWEQEVFKPTQQVECKGFTASVRVFNHFTSNLFCFDRLPYFITSDDAFFARYASLFRRNARLTAEDWQGLWRNSDINAAFYLERRDDEKYDRAFPDQQIYGLCRYRSMLAEQFDRPGVVRAGLGWASKRRQSLPDWHLDKLAALDRRVRFVSALENTHQQDYITEKFFDAFASGGIPLYWASELHRANQLVEPDSFVNLYGLSVDEACARMDGFTATQEFAESYCKTQQRLADLFSNPEVLRLERIGMIDRLFHALV
ncbi:MAG: glycosyltransferase family 10 [Pseudomonadales bacterium]